VNVRVYRIERVQPGVRGSLTILRYRVVWPREDLSEVRAEVRALNEQDGGRHLITHVSADALVEHVNALMDDNARLRDELAQLRGAEADS
jgi:hypothetical protein